jgi:hypothetical protein
VFQFEMSGDHDVSIHPWEFNSIMENCSKMKYENMSEPYYPPLAGSRSWKQFFVHHEIIIKYNFPSINEQPLLLPLMRANKQTCLRDHYTSESVVWCAVMITMERKNVSWASENTVVAGNGVTNRVNFVSVAREESAGNWWISIIFNYDEMILWRKNAHTVRLINMTAWRPEASESRSVTKNFHLIASRQSSFEGSLSFSLSWFPLSFPRSIANYWGMSGELLAVSCSFQMTIITSVR